MRPATVGASGSCSYAVPAVGFLASPWSATLAGQVLVLGGTQYRHVCHPTFFFGVEIFDPPPRCKVTVQGMPACIVRDTADRPAAPHTTHPRSSGCGLWVVSLAWLHRSCPGGQYYSAAKGHTRVKLDAKGWLWNSARVVDSTQFSEGTGTI